MKTHEKSLQLGINFGVTRAEYDADTGINQSVLKDLIKAKSPFHFRHKQLNPDDGDKPHFRLGNAIDLLCSTPHKFKDQFTTWTGGRRAGKEWDKFSEDAAKAGLTVLTQGEVDQVRGMVKGIQRNEEFANIIINSQKQVAVVSEVDGLRKKGLLDFFPDVHSEWIFDLKSSGKGADAATFHKQCFDLGYNLQAAHYLDLCRAAGMGQLRKFGFLVVETFPPYETAIHWLEIDDEETIKGREQLNKAISDYLLCSRNNHWPGYSKGWTKIKFTKWQLEGRERQYETID